MTITNQWLKHVKNKYEMTCSAQMYAVAQKANQDLVDKFGLTILEVSAAGFIKTHDQFEYVLNDGDGYGFIYYSCNLSLVLEKQGLKSINGIGV